MAELFKLRVITPDGIFYEGEASMVEMNTSEGQIGVYKNHVPMTYIVAPGILSIHEAEETKLAALHKGFVEILQEQITVMAEAVEWPWEIDKNRAEEAKIRAERRLGESAGSCDRQRAELALRRALVRMELTK